VWHGGVEVEDVRPYKESLSFNKEGFIVLDHASSVGTRTQEDLMKKDLEDMTELLRVELQADKTICYDVRVSFALVSSISQADHPLDAFKWH
jgi:hypothetical protein